MVFEKILGSKLIIDLKKYLNIKKNCKFAVIISKIRKIMEQNKKNPVKTVIMLVFIAFSIIMTVFYCSEKSKVKVFVEKEQKEFKMQKEKLMLQLNDMSSGYDNLKTSNDTLNTQLEEQQVKIQELKNKLQKSTTTTALDLDKYRKEIESLKEIMRSYIKQIDELNTKNKVLTQENTEVKANYEKSETLNKDLSIQNETLFQKVTIASQIKAVNFKAATLNKKKKAITRAKQLEYLNVSLTLIENKIAESGAKNIYIKIIRPDQVVFANSEKNLFNFGESQMIYTAVKTINYTGDNQNVDIEWERNFDSKEIPKGNYEVDIYMDGKKIGSTGFTLK